MNSSAVFFFNDTATTEIYTLSLHDALPISVVAVSFVITMFTPAGRLKRAIRAGFPILGAAVILGSGALAWSAFGPGRQSDDPLVVGIGDSRRTNALSPIDEATRADGHRVFVISGNVGGLYPGA